MSFCVKCGTDTDDTIDGLCVECFLDGRKLTTLPHHVDLQICANCKEIKLQERWVDKSIEDAVENAAADSLMMIKEAKPVSMSVSSIEQDPHTFAAVVETVLDINGYISEDRASTIVRVKNTVCKRCSRQLGNYYESILQIRAGTGRSSQRIMREALNRVENHVYSHASSNRQLFITKTEEVQGGLDVYLSSISLGKSVAKDLSDTYFAETKEASKLVGRTSEGLDMYRITYLVRLPDFHAGDVVIFDKRYYKLSKLSGNGAKIIDLLNFTERSVKRADMHDIKVYRISDELTDVTVVSRSGNEIQILDPYKYLTVDMQIPDEAEIGDTVKAVEIDDAFYYVP